ncbi:LysR family transcriptional regulator [Wenjunlia vitaminophila]|uniref:LysR family transcriptional regulator n=1 Tax=Wenjunlia vitaminophila TaxID=76728 RepID=UPI00036CD366|nr:LysR substrate-binding domain-containing protein [Wenjunlia vitaminophila]
MELHQLRYFVAVAEEQNFTRAAERLHVAQPGVSSQVRRLERELGQELLDRTGREVRLTEVGAAVLPYARAALTAVEGVRLAVDEFTGLLRGHVAVGAVTSHDIDLPGLLAGYHADHPAVEITLTEGDSERLAEDLRGGRLDLALISLSSRTPPDLEVQVVVDQPIVLAVGHDHELAVHTAVSLATLRGRALISLPRGTGLRTLLDEACASAGFTPRIAFEATDPDTLARFAARGLGAAVLPHAFASARTGALRTIALTHPAMRGRLALAWRSGGPSSPAGRTLVARARAAFEPAERDVAAPVNERRRAGAGTADGATRSASAND